MSFNTGTTRRVSGTSSIILGDVGVSRLGRADRVLGSLTGVVSRFSVGRVGSGPKLFKGLFKGFEGRLSGVLTGCRAVNRRISGVCIRLGKCRSRVGRSGGGLSAVFGAGISCCRRLIGCVLTKRRTYGRVRTCVTRERRSVRGAKSRSVRFRLADLGRTLVVLRREARSLEATRGITVRSVPVVGAVRFDGCGLIEGVGSTFVIALPMFGRTLTRTVLLGERGVRTRSVTRLSGGAGRVLLGGTRGAMSMSGVATGVTSKDSVRVRALRGA